MSELEPFLTFDVRNAIVAHAREVAPNECCGVITFSSGSYDYVRKENVDADPAHMFSFDERTSKEVQLLDSVVAYVHSHPNGDPWPTKFDMEVQRQVGKPSVICSVDRTGKIEVFSFGDHLLDLPLNGRTFRYGVTDCYEAIRSWVWQNQQVKLDQFPRHNDWWSIGVAASLDDVDRDMYTRYYESQGYVPFEPNMSDPRSDRHPKVGDLALMQIGSGVNVINHGAIYTGNNLIYHHRFGKRSGETAMGYLPPDTIRRWARLEGRA